MTCEKCHHRPSERRYTAWHTQETRLCYCPCHDVADAGPRLLEACKTAIDAIIESGDPFSGSDQALVAMLRAAIVEAGTPSRGAEPKKGAEKA